MVEAAKTEAHLKPSSIFDGKEGGESGRKDYGLGGFDLEYNGRFEINPQFSMSRTIIKIQKGK